jgi:hypothetical protein
VNRDVQSNEDEIEHEGSYRAVLRNSRLATLEGCPHGRGERWSLEFEMA